jgi:hypothetical protein
MADKRKLPQPVPEHGLEYAGVARFQGHHSRPLETRSHILGPFRNAEEPKYQAHSYPPETAEEISPLSRINASCLSAALQKIHYILLYLQK